MKKIVIATILVFGVTQAIIAKDVSPVTTITKIYTYTTGAVLKLATPSTNNSGCTYSKSGEYLAIRFNTPEERVLFSSVLTAFTIGTPIQVASRGCDAIWGTSKTMNKVYSLTIVK